MKKILLNASNPDEKKIAVLSEGRLSDYISYLPGTEDRRNNIYRGIVKKIEPSLDACFVDIGDEKNGFLQISEIADSYLKGSPEQPLNERIDPESVIKVQIIKDSRSEKGPLLTSRIKLMGHWLLLEAMPRTTSGLVITRAASGKEKADILESRDSLAPPAGMNLIVRSAGLGVKTSDLFWEFNSYLLPLWRKINEVSEQLEGPQLIYNDMDIVNRCVREHFTPAVTEVMCDSEKTASEVRQLFDAIMPDMANRVAAIADGAALFDERVLGQIDALLAREVRLPSGGALVIDITEALVAIDVNSGRNRGQSNIEDTAFKTNCEAAEEIARQLRLRNLSGIIAADFIDMEDEENKASLVNVFSKALRRDRAQVQIGSLSEFGIMEMTRQNIGRALHEAHSTLCNKCAGIGRLPTVRSFALHQLDKIHDLCINRKQCGMITLLMPIEPATYLLNENRLDLRRLEEQFGIDIVIVPSRNMEMPQVNVRIDKVSSLNSVGTSYGLDREIQSTASDYRSEQNARRQEAVPAISNYTPEPRTSRPAPPAPDTAASGPAAGSAERPGIFKSLFGMFRASSDDNGKAADPKTEPEQKRRRPRQQARAAHSGGNDREKTSDRPRRRGGRNRRGGRQQQGASGRKPEERTNVKGAPGSRSGARKPAAADSEPAKDKGPQTERPQTGRPQSERPQSERPQSERPQAERSQTERSQSERSQSGGLSRNGLSRNGLRLSGLSRNGLSRGGLSRSGLSRSGLSRGGLSRSGLSRGGLSRNGLSRGGLSRNGLRRSRQPRPDAMPPAWHPERMPIRRKTPGKTRCRKLPHQIILAPAQGKTRSKHPPRALPTERGLPQFRNAPFQARAKNPFFACSIVKPTRPVPAFPGSLPRPLIGPLNSRNRCR